MLLNLPTGDRCPNCGSTSQTRKQEEKRSADTLIEFFNCGCGCTFKKIYKVQSIESNIRVKKER